MAEDGRVRYERMIEVRRPNAVREIGKVARCYRSPNVWDPNDAARTLKELRDAVDEVERAIAKRTPQVVQRAAQDARATPAGDTVESSEPGNRPPEDTPEGPLDMGYAKWALDKLIMRDYGAARTFLTRAIQAGARP